MLRFDGLRRLDSLLFVPGLTHFIHLLPMFWFDCGVHASWWQAEALHCSHHGIAAKTVAAFFVFLHQSSASDRCGTMGSHYAFTKPSTRASYRARL
jgi:hypothetical protein